MPNNQFAVILAGGSGERFWPLSRKSTPKQLLKLFGDKTLLENTLDRLDGLVDPKNILILTNTEQEASTRRIIGSRLPKENILAEPAKRDTAPAVALGVAWVASRDPKGVMAILPADHLINDSASFRSNLAAAYAVASDERALVTIGIKPTWPCPSFGYVETSGAIPSKLGKVHRVSTFREKPTRERAEQFLAKGGYFWNAGMFVWSVSAIHCELAAHAPELSDFVHRNGSAGLGANWPDEFVKLGKVSIDYAILEKASRVLMVESEFDWDDVGGWVAVSKYLDTDAQSNASNCIVHVRDSSGNIIHTSGKKPIALLGVHDLIIVEVDDAILIASKAEAERIKEIVAALPAELQ